MMKDEHSCREMKKYFSEGRYEEMEVDMKKNTQAHIMHIYIHN